MSAAVRAGRTGQFSPTSPALAGAGAEAGSSRGAVSAEALARRPTRARARNGLRTRLTPALSRTGFPELDRKFERGFGGSLAEADPSARLTRWAEMQAKSVRLDARCSDGSRA